MRAFWLFAVAGHAAADDRPSRPLGKLPRPLALGSSQLSRVSWMLSGNALRRKRIRSESSSTFAVCGGGGEYTYTKPVDERWNTHSLCKTYKLPGSCVPAVPGSWTEMCTLYNLFECMCTCCYTVSVNLLHVLRGPPFFTDQTCSPAPQQKYARQRTFPPFYW